MAPFARILAQLIIQGGSILTRAVFTAYQQALRSDISRPQSYVL